MGILAKGLQSWSLKAGSDASPDSTMHLTRTSVVSFLSEVTKAVEKGDSLQDRRECLLS